MTGSGQAEFRVGDKVTYRCDTSVVVRDRMCLSSGEWSPMAVVCDICPTDWHYEASTGQCYGVSSHAMTMSEAREDCGVHGGELVTAKTEAENVFLQNMIVSDVWIPVTDEVKEGTWVWLDGEAAVWTNWQVNQPDNWGRGGQQCVVMRRSSGQWLDKSCHEKNRFVCKTRVIERPVCDDFWDTCQELFEKNPEFCEEHSEFALRMCPDTCGICRTRRRTKQCKVSPLPNTKAIVVDRGVIVDDVTILSKGNTVKYECDAGYVTATGDSVRGCLMNGEMAGQPLQCVPGCPRGWMYLKTSRVCVSVFTHEQVDAETAKARCAALNGVLAMPKTAADNRQMTELLKVTNISGKVLIGLDDKILEGDFVWADGEPLSLRGWSKWGKLQPDDWYGQDCVYLSGVDGTWYDAKCNQPMFYSCQATIESAEPLVDECRIDPPPNQVSVSVDLHVSSTVSLGQSVDYSCSGGYILTSGDPSRLCLANGKLSGDLITCGKGCDAGWDYNVQNGKCFKFFDEAVNWEVAKARCQELGASLPMPKTASETRWLVGRNPRDKIWQWIDLSDRVKENEFVWGDGVPLRESGWSFWYTGQPIDYGNRDCVFIREGGKWMAGFCVKHKRRFNCQKDLFP